jgi:hypothetical protein
LSSRGRLESKATADKTAAIVVGNFGEAVLVEVNNKQVQLIYQVTGEKVVIPGTVNKPVLGAVIRDYSQDYEKLPLAPTRTARPTATLVPV